MSWIRNLLTGIAWGLAGISRVALPSRGEDRVESVDSVRDEWAVESTDVILSPAFHREFHARYIGPWSPAPTLSAEIREETEKFIRARMR